MLSAFLKFQPFRTPDRRGRRSIPTNTRIKTARFLRWESPQLVPGLPMAQPPLEKPNPRRRGIHGDGDLTYKNSSNAGILLPVGH